MDLFNWVSLGIVPIGSLLTWFAARRVRNNSTLQNQQDTIDMLIKKNAELYAKIVEQATKISEQATDITEMKMEIAALRKQIKTPTRKPKTQL